MNILKLSIVIESLKFCLLFLFLSLNLSLLISFIEFENTTKWLCAIELRYALMHFVQNNLGNHQYHLE